LLYGRAAFAQERVMSGQGSDVCWRASFWKAFVGSAPLGVAVMDAALRCLYVNDALASMSGLESEAHTGRTLDVCGFHFDAQARASLRTMLDEDAPSVSVELTGERPSCPGVRRHYGASFFKLADCVDGARFGALIFDNTERRLAREKLQHDALHDRLTGLPNRALFADRLRQAVERARRHSSSRFAVIFLDLDGFKEVNDSHGHAAGDRLLVEVARRLLCCVRSGDTAARHGGDEFTLLLEEVSSREVVFVAERINREVSAPFVVGGREICVTASLGIRYSVLGDCEPDLILRDADNAMYAAKRSGKARYVSCREMPLPEVAQN
jgi:diguanylate cyclase (GGDEF)-like protein